ncbi:MAG: AraC family transcriptional regulator, partial [Agathobacter rectalis]
QMDTAITYFNTNYNRAINVEEYASSIGMSISWFIRSFRKYTGNTPVQFLTALRMTNAQVLLETTSYSINEIAGIVGYNNPLYFSRLFHKQKGCSPSEYRARNT